MRKSSGVRKDGICHCGEPRVHGIVQAVLLLLLKERHDHGYELVRRLAREVPEDMVPDATVVYRMLRELERAGAVRSELQPGAGGPARKVYALTEAGEAQLAAWDRTAERRIRTLEHFRQRFTEIPERSRRGRHPGAEEATE